MRVPAFSFKTKRKAYHEQSVLRSSSLGSEDLQGFIDDDPMHNLVGFDVDGIQTKRRRRFITGKCLILTMIALAVVGIAVGIGIALTKGEKRVSGTGGTKVSGSKEIPGVPSDLHVVCAPMHIQSDQGYNDCLELCQPAQCCEYIPENDLSCVEEHRQDCEKYRASCQHLDHKKAADTDITITVDKACSTNSLMSVEGVQTCSDTCQTFNCCFDKSGDFCDVSEATCADNGACATALLVDADGFDSHKEAKDAIAFACQDMSSYEGQTQCTNVCNPSVCCFLSPSAWKQPCDVNCDHYEACSNLYGPILRGDTADQHAVFSVPYQVEMACNPAQLGTLTGVRGCFDLCQHHLCCFDDPEVGGCMDTNKEECNLYSACRTLIDVQDTSKQPAEICAPGIVESNGPRECMQSCAKSYCCLFDARYEASCANDELCSDYKACDILAPEKPEEEDPDLVQTINKVCTVGNLGSMLGATECEKGCSARGCCIETGASNCKISDSEYCIEVDSCQLIFEIDPIPEIDGEVEPKEQGPNVVTQELEKACNSDNLATISGYHNCYDQCYYHLCCFADDPDLNCKDKKGEGECSEYTPCQALLDTSGVEDAALDDVCSSSSVETISGLEQCRKQCAPFLCCFQDPNLPSSCVGWYGQKTCGDYDPCKILVSDSSHSVYNEEDPYLVALINNYCKPESVADQENARHCMTQCEKRGCCYNTGDCYDMVSLVLSKNALRMKRTHSSPYRIRTGVMRLVPA